MRYSLSINDQGEGFITFVSNGTLQTVPSDHAYFRQAAAAILNDEDPSEFLRPSVLNLSDRVTLVGDDELHFDGEPVDNRLTRTIVRYQAEGRDTEGLVAFMEKLAANPSKRARTELFDFVENQQLTITPEGDFVAHKAVRPADDDDYDEVDLSLAGFGWDEDNGGDLFASISQGTASVNGVEFTGAIPNFVGAVVTMPRKDVDDDHGQDCSEGLHVGSFRYASTFGGYSARLMEVAVSPADVVTVPKYDTNKLRCCRYTVLAVQEEKQADLSHYEAGATAGLDDVFELLEDYDIPESFITRLKARLNGATA